MKRILPQDRNLLQEIQKLITITIKRALHQDQSLLREIQKETIIPITLVTMSVKILQKIIKTSIIKRDQHLVLFLNLHQGKFNSNKKDQSLNLDQNLPQENNYKNVIVVLPAQDHLKISQETQQDRTLERKSLILVLDLDRDKIEDKSNLIKLQNYGITKEEIITTTGIIVIEIIITSLTSTEMIEEAVEEEEAVLIVEAIKVATTIEIAITEAIILTIITTTTKRIIVNYSMYPKPILRTISIVIIDMLF